MPLHGRSSHNREGKRELDLAIYFVIFLSNAIWRVINSICCAITVCVVLFGTDWLATVGGLAGSAGAICGRVVSSGRLTVTFWARSFGIDAFWAGFANSVSKLYRSR